MNLVPSLRYGELAMTANMLKSFTKHYKNILTSLYEQDNIQALFNAQEVKMTETQSTQPTVWGVAVGERGDELEAINSKLGPYPPKPGSEGYIAIGWPMVGTMDMYRENYADFVNKFRKCYPYNQDERVVKLSANKVWNFAFKMKEGDWVICPSSATKYLLVGQVVSGYIDDFENATGLFGIKTRIDFVHFRKVRWQYIVPAKDPRYSQLNKIGIGAVTCPDITVDQLLAILKGGPSAGPNPPSNLESGPSDA